MKPIQRLLARGTLLAMLAASGPAVAEEMQPNVAVPYLPPSALTPPTPAPVGPNTPFPALEILGRGVRVIHSRIFNGAPPVDGRGPYYGGGWYRPYGYYANRPL